MSLKKWEVRANRETGVSERVGGFGSIAARMSHETGRERKPRQKSDQTKRRESRDAKWSRQVKERAQGVCQDCGGLGEEAHHLGEKGSARFRPYRHDLRNGCWLCRSCHQTGPKAAHRDLPAYREKMALRLDYFRPLYDEMTSRGHR